MAATTSKGEVMLAGTVNPTGGLGTGGAAGGGGINGSDFDGIWKTNNDVMTKAIRTLPNWKSGEEFSIVAIPGEEQAFEMCQVPSTGYTYNANPELKVVPIVHLAMYARSMTPGDLVNYEVVWVWESEMAKSNSTDVTTPQVVPVDSKTLNVATSKARPYATSNSAAGIHALPWVETLGQTQPNALVALGRHPDIPQALRPTATTGPIVAHTGSEPSFFGKVLNLGKSLIKEGAKTGYLKKIPYIGNALQGVASVLSGLFD
jgi:hypothetical protein